MAKKIIHRGGQRSNAGRKTLPDSEKKMTLSIYPPKKWVDHIGLERAKELMFNLLKEQYNFIIKSK